MNVPLLAVPPGVVTTIGPVSAPIGTRAVTCVAELITNEALTPLNVTSVVWVSPVPVITTGVPTVPLVGLNPTIVGPTLKTVLLVRVPTSVVTVTGPVVPVTGTIAVK